MFNGYNDSALISYEFNEEREKKSENVSKYCYGHDGGVQSTPTHPNNRQSEFWSGKPNFIGIPNVVKCNCTGCYPTTENQSYQVESTRHRPWLPKTFPVPLNGSNECKLPAYQWNSGLNQICYSDPNVPYGQENGGKHAFYRQFQTSNQPSVIISANKQKTEMGFQNGVRQPVMCNPGYDLTKRVSGRSYYDGDKYSLGAYSINQIPRLPVEPYTKAVPSNLNQNRVPSTGQRKENSPQYDHCSGTKIFPDNYHPGLSPMDFKNSGIHVDYSTYFNRDPELYRNNYTEMKRNNLAMQNRKDCAVTQGNLEQHYGRSKHPENLKGCELFYPNFDKNQIDSCIQRIENDGVNRVSRSVMVCNDLRYSDERPQVFPYQNNGAYRNYVRSEYPQFNSQCSSEVQEIDKNQCRALPQHLQNCPQGNNGCTVDPQKCNSDKTQSYGKTQVVDAQPKPNYLETIRSEKINKNGTSKISPLRLLRKKKFVAAPQELSFASTNSEAPMLDVRKFWSTWAEEEDENVSPTQMVVLDCQNIDPEQAKLLNFYETDPSRPINLENVILKNPDCVKGNIENVKASEQPVDGQEKEVEIATQIEPVIKDIDEVIPELDAANASPNKCRSHERQKKKMEEFMDKWTEKKFDFLKKSEESKAAEMMRYEEEKKKIFERRQSFQQIDGNKIETSPKDDQKFDENSQSNSPKERTTSDLPTSEYRRNKFLDYSKVIVNGCVDSQKVDNKESDNLADAIVLKEEASVKPELYSPLEMDDILKKISEINFQEVKLESESSKKAKKVKRKKLDQSETDAKADLKVEAVSQPTIKFSIQKSHDLKISFKVLNKKYEEEVQSEETEPIKDNTELITLKYKSIQNGGKLSDEKKKRGKLRKKKHGPISRIKKSRYADEELDPLGEDDEANSFPTDDFQVQETVDSAKIKLTFKRHKTNLETKYKIDGEGLDVGLEEPEKNSEVIENRCRKKSKKSKKHKISVEEDTESPHLELKPTESLPGDECNSKCIFKNGSDSVAEDGEKSVSDQLCSINKEEAAENSSSLFEMPVPEKRLCENSVQNDVLEHSKCEIDSAQLDLRVYCDETTGSNDRQEKEHTEDAILKSLEDEKAKEEIQEISLDFISNNDSPDIETDRELQKTEEIKTREATEERNKNDGIESTNENHSSLKSSYDLKEDLDCSETEKKFLVISLEKINAGVESDSDNEVSIDIIREVPKKEIELRNSPEFSSESIPENHTNPKQVQDNFEGGNSKDKTADLELDFEKSVEYEIPKDNESDIEFEDVSLNIADSEDSESRSDCREDARKEPSAATTSKEVHLMLNKVIDKEHFQLFEIQPDGAAPPNDNTIQLKVEAGLNDCNQIDKLHEPDNMIEGEDIQVENLEAFTKYINEDSFIDDKFDSESQTIDLPRIENEESRTSPNDQAKLWNFRGDDQQKSFIEPEVVNCSDYETKDNFLHDSGTCRFLEDGLPCEKNDKTQIETTAIDGEVMKDCSFTKEREPQNINPVSPSGDTTCDDIKPNSEIRQLENTNQRAELTNVGIVSQGSEIDHLSHTTNDINEENDNVLEQGGEIFCNFKNPNECLNQADKMVDSNEGRKDPREGEKNEPEIEFDLPNCDNQNTKVSNLVRIKDCSEAATEEGALMEVPKTKLDNEEIAVEADSSNQESDLIFNENSGIIDTEKKSEVLNNFKDDEKNCSQMVYLEKPDEENKKTETSDLNHKLSSLIEVQENTIVIENKNQPDSYSAVASPIEQSRINSLTGFIKPQSNEEKGFVKNSSPRVDVKCSSLESPLDEESELEDGEIVDGSSDDSDLTDEIVSSDVSQAVKFKVQKPIRRHSINFRKTESHKSSSWCQRRFAKGKSCPPRLKGEIDQLPTQISVEDIPLPIGPPPLGSCFMVPKIIAEAKVTEKAKEKQEQCIVRQVLEVNRKEALEDLSLGSPFGTIQVEYCRNPSPPRSDALGAHRSKIKFSLTKRSRFSKIGIQSEKPRMLERPKIFEKIEPKVVASADIVEPELTKTVKTPEPEISKTAGKPELKFNETTEKLELNYNETAEKPEQRFDKFPEKCDLEIDESISEETETNGVDLTGKTEVEVAEPIGKLESLSVEFSEIIESEANEPVENIELEIVESNFILNSQTEGDINKIRTPDYESEAVEERRECQIVEVPNSCSTHTHDKDQKSDVEVESLCEDTNVEVLDVMSDFIRDEFYEDIPTSEDLPNGDSLDEKVNDDKFRNIMQNCLENAKKFLNVGNVKLFSCSVDDLLELDNQENDATTNHISRDVLLTSCDDANDDLGLNEKFQPVDISMEFLPSDVCPEILPVDNWPYLEEEVPSSPLKSNETELILENTISEVVPNRKRAAQESENYKRFRRKSLVDDEDMLCSKIEAHRRKTVDGFNTFLSYTKLNEVDKPNQSLKCRLSLEKLNNNGVEFISPQGDLSRKGKNMQVNKKLNYKSSIWQPKVMLIRISENEVKRFKKTKTRSRSDNNLDSLPAVKKLKSDDTNNHVEKEFLLPLPPVDSMVPPTDAKRHKPRFRNLHTKRKPEQEQSQPKAIETALSEIFKDSDKDSKSTKCEKTYKNDSITESKPKIDKQSSRTHSLKDKHSHRDRRRENERDHRKHSQKHKHEHEHERSKHEDGKKRKSSHSDDDRKRSITKSSNSQKEASPKKPWACEVCGFNDAVERVAHIKSHPFHCQSCHLAFKTEAFFNNHLTEMHKDIRNQHHCLLCELSFDTEEEYQRHLASREHRHLEAVEKNTINTLFKLLTGAPCPVLGLVEMKPEWLPNQPGTVHFYHQATPLSLALQYLKMHHDLTSYSEVSKVHPN